MRAIGWEQGLTFLAESPGAVPPDNRVALMVSIPLVIGDGQINPAVLVEIRRNTRARGMIEKS